jgi:ribonuclease HII
MTWLIGIDEAGYGPNLGPFVMTCVACRVPDDLGSRDLWQLLSAAVRRAGEPDDGRIPVGDSKLLFSTTRGLRPLETAVLAAQPLDTTPLPLERYLDHLCPHWLPELRRECWFTGQTPLPIEEAAEARERVRAACRAVGVTWAAARAVVVCPARFNALTELAGSKGAVLQHGLIELVRHLWDALPGDEPLAFTIDKHGGRNTYAAMLQEAVPEGMVVVEEEGAARSTYRTWGGRREARWTFQPRADGESFCTALASMIAKHIRERLMGEFNAFWLHHQPGLKPTAGYPVDAARFFEAIRPLLPGLGLAEDAVWRKR